jgi:hypothetical protein
MKSLSIEIHDLFEIIPKEVFDYAPEEVERVRKKLKTQKEKKRRRK